MINICRRIKIHQFALILIFVISLVFSSCGQFLPNNNNKPIGDIELSDPSDDEESTTPTIIEETTTQTVERDTKYYLFGMEDLLYYRKSSFKEFELSEVWIDGAPYYQFTNQQYDIIVLIGESQENATLYHSDKSMPIDLKYGITSGAGATSTEFYLMDLTGDDYVEFITWGTTGGTGGANQYVHVYDLVNMEEIIIEDYLYKLYSYFEIKPIETDKNNVTSFEIKTTKGDEFIRSLSIPFENTEDYEFDEECLQAHNTIAIDDKTKRINIEHGVTVRAATYREYLGNVKGYLVYNESSNKFELVDDYEFE